MKALPLSTQLGQDADAQYQKFEAYDEIFLTLSSIVSVHFKLYIMDLFRGGGLLKFETRDPI